jgi:hypothetical protein
LSMPACSHPVVFRLTGNAAHALIGDQVINNRQVNSAGQAGFEAAGTAAIVTCG